MFTLYRLYSIDRIFYYKRNFITLKNKCSKCLLLKFYLFVRFSNYVAPDSEFEFDSISFAFGHYKRTKYLLQIIDAQ